jgi:nitroreductase
MDFFAVIKSRHSTRAFKDRAVEREKMQQILEAINRAPSAGNLQAYEVYSVSDAGHKAALVKTADQEFLGQAPVVLVFCTHGARAEAKYRERGTELYCIQDATIACTFAMLAATALGLSTVWMGAFDEEQVRDAIGVPEDQRPIAMLPVGYAAETPEIKPRREVDDLVHGVESA